MKKKTIVILSSLLFGSGLVMGYQTLYGGEKEATTQTQSLSYGSSYRNMHNRFMMDDRNEDRDEKRKTMHRFKKGKECHENERRPMHRYRYKEESSLNQKRKKEFITDENEKEAKKPLFLPPLLEPLIEEKDKIKYNIVAQQGETSILKGKKTKTLGYNGSFLGPVLRIKKGQEVTIQTQNQLQQETSFHWHGLKIPSSVDGSPHQVVLPNEKEEVTFKVDQQAATLWFHPHAEGTTAYQVYQGLAGLIYIDDDNEKKQPLPRTYGIDDIPVVIQDRTFDQNNQFDYEKAYDSDGTGGKTWLINGSTNAFFETTTQFLRLRLVNGSNGTNLKYNLKDDQSFFQIASDGGLLNQPVEMNTLRLSPGERAEILIDTSQFLTKTSTLNVNDKTMLTLHKRKEIKNVEFNSQQQLNTLKPLSKSKRLALPVQKITLSGHAHMVSIDKESFDKNHIHLTKKIGTTEIWEVTNKQGMMSMAHPFHIHGVQFKLLTRNGKTPPLNERGDKDTVLINAGETVRLLVTFDQKGIFMYHCHILEHEENGMMAQLEVIE